MGHLERQQALDEEFAGCPERARALRPRPRSQERAQQGAVLNRRQVVHAEALDERLPTQVVGLLQGRLPPPSQVVLQRTRVALRQLSELPAHVASPR